MTQKTQITIEVIDDKSPYLKSVIELGDANKATLGFFSKGSFSDRAARRQVIIALDSQASFMGYLLYRASPSYDRISIIHLCINPSHRGKKLTKKLVDYLIEITQQYSGIGLTCRRDYGLDDMWSKLGFVAQYNKPAKTLGKQSTFWWLDYGKPNLFYSGAIQQRENKLSVVIDANIFFDLTADENIANQESKLLLADWLQPELDLCLTDEIFNKINTISNENQIRYQRNFARKTFTIFPCENQRFDLIHQSLKTFFAQHHIEIDESDIRYLARNIASDIHIFVTRDIHLLDIANELYNIFRLSIIPPHNLILQLDEICRKPEYQPVRLVGTSLNQIRISMAEKYRLSELVIPFHQGENNDKFQQRLLRFLAEPNKFECSIVMEGENKLLALIVYDRHKKHELEIPMLRVGDNPLSATLTRHLILQSISLSAREKRQFTRITDPYLQETVTTAIHEDTFVRVDGGYLRANLAVAETASQLSMRLTNLAIKFGQDYNFCQKFAEILSSDDSTSDTQTMAQIERRLWPAKVTDADIPIFIIPIEPKWAMDLFDEKLANQTLFGAKTELAFNREAVYYKSVTHAKVLQAPCRILWYVSQGKDKHNSFCGVGEIRGCSLIDEVSIAKPQELYQRFQRLGVYKLADICKIKNNKDGNIMAIRFSNTELFDYPISLKTNQVILNNKWTFQGILQIDKNHFKQLYNLGVTNQP